MVAWMGGNQSTQDYAGEDRSHSSKEGRQPMKNGPDEYRILNGHWGSPKGADYGSFRIPGPCGEDLMVIASPGDADENIPWEHVSISTRNRCPRWNEMCFIKELFWDDEDAVMQLHPPKSTWINNHAFCLHLWRPQDGNIPLPPSIAVGYAELNR
jgi:hypothetical protein